MKVGVLHNSMNTFGGGERVTINILEALENAGHQVVLATVEPTDWNYFSYMLGRNVRFNEINLIPVKLRAFGIYMRLMSSLLVSRLRDCDIVINTHGDMIIAKTDMIYIHFPTFKLMEQLLDVRVKYRKNILWRFYFEPYYQMQKLLWKWALKDVVVLTNHMWAKEQIKELTGKDAIITYPPVHLFKSAKKEDIVLTVSRFTWEKRLDAIPKIAKELPNVRFAIIGSTFKTSNLIANAIKKQNVPNVELYPDASPHKLEELYSKAKFYLHAMHGEHFGITIVEGMSAGCVPIVHKSGGPWHDITCQGKYGFGYSDDGEVVHIIKTLLSDNSSREKYSKLATGRAKIFSEESFRSRFIDVINKLYPQLVGE